jgi:aromatic-L-amino-acid decarboxylase
MEPEEIRALGYRIVDMIVGEFADPSRRPVFPPPQTWEAMERAFGGPVPRSGMEAGQVLSIVEEHLLPAAGNPNHPKAMAYVLTASQPLPALMEALVATIKLRPTTWKNQPGSCHIEATVARWLGSMVGFSENAAGYVTTGGSTANLFALAVARVRRAGWDVRADGIHGGPQLIAYVSAESHSCFERSAQMMGMGSAGLRKIPVDEKFCIRMDLLEEAIERDLARGYRPFCIVGNAGTVDTGAVDPLHALADLAARHGAWFHVDGAYGAFAAMVPATRDLFAGLARADSLTVDPHKWLNVPFEAGCILVRNRQDLSDTFCLIPPYLRGALGADDNQYECGFELSRADRALKVWLALRQHGTDWYAEMIRHHMELARYLARLVDEAADFELVCAPVLSIVCFRYVPAGRVKDLNELNELNFGLEMALIEDGRALVSGTELNGIRVLRACIASLPVTKAAVGKTLEILREIGASLQGSRASGGEAAIDW